MGPAGNDGGVRTITIEFPNANRAQVVVAAPRRSAEVLLSALGLTEPRPVLLVIGGAESLDPAIAAQLERLLDRGAIRAADDAGATLLGGGTASGVMAVLGRASAASDATVELVGVAPGGKVTYPGDDRQVPDAATQLEPNHTHFILANSTAWGGETSLLFDVLEVLSRDRPRAAILAGGGPIALEEARIATQMGVPMVALTGTGGIADDLATRARSPRRVVSDDALSRIASEADLTILPVGSDPGDLEAVVARLLRADETLAEAWRQQRLMSGAAARQQRGFRRMQLSLLMLGLLLTFLVVTKAVLDAAGVLDDEPRLDRGLYFVILVLPITIAGLAAAAGRMRPGGRWILLRGTSEALKREIFRYRARAGIYSHEQTRKMSRQVKLAEAIGSAMGALMRTDVNLLALDDGADRRNDPGSRPPDQPADDQLTPLTPAGYIKHRVDPQIAWYRRKAAEHERSARWLRGLAIVFGGVGTLLAAIGLDIWVAVTTALVGVFATILEAWQLETTVSLYNQAATDLLAIRTRWFALPPAEQDRQRSIDRLVERSERIIRAEHVGWVQEMQDAMTQLRLEQASDRASGGATDSTASGAEMEEDEDEETSA